MAIRLEVFETSQAADPGEMIVTDSGHFEEIKLASFEEGYTAGWEDAVAAHVEEQARLSEDLARNLQGLAFTYHEARDHVLRAVEPLIVQMASQLLPRLAAASLGPILVETMRPHMAAATEMPITLVINPAVRPVVELLVAANGSVPVDIAEDPSLTEGQALIRFAQAETRVDLDHATSAILAAVDDFFTLTFKENDRG